MSTQRLANERAETHDPRSDKDTITPELHHQGSISGRGNPTSSEPVSNRHTNEDVSDRAAVGWGELGFGLHDNGQSLEPGSLLQEMVRRLNVLPT